MGQIQSTIDVVEKLTTAYYAALGIVFTIVLGVIAFLIYDKQSLKKEMRDKYNEILDSKVHELQKEFNIGLNKIESINDLKLKYLEIETYRYYLTSSIRNYTTRANKRLIWSIILNLFKKYNRYVDSLVNNSELTAYERRKIAQKTKKEIETILRICQTKKYLLFKRLNEDRKKQIESVNSVVEELNNKISNILNSSTDDKITTIDIDEMIKKQEKEPDIKDRLETIKKIKMD